MSWERQQFDLLRFTTKEDLSRIVESFCRLTGLSGGVVAMPENPKKPPRDENVFDRYRLTLPDAVNQYEFCKHVRGCSKGNVKCMWSDLKEARRAVALGRPVSYQCHLGLIDIVAPIRVAGHHVANVYLGEVRPPNFDFNRAWKQYETLRKASKTVRTSPTKKQMREFFMKLPSRTDKEIESLREHANVLSELISQRATRQAAIVVALDAAHEVGATLNLHTSLSIYLKHAQSLLNSSTGSIFLLNDAKDRLVCFAHEWGEDAGVHIELSLDSNGLIPQCARENIRRYHGDVRPKYDENHIGAHAFVVRHGTRSQIDRASESALSWTRNKRDLESILIVPITCGHEFLGVLDVGSSIANAYSSDDERVLRLFAREVGLCVRNARERELLLGVFSENDPLQLGRVLSREIPLHVEGTGCSIFVKRGNAAELFGTNEFPGDQKQVIFYEVGEGFTGWVLKTGRPLRVPAGHKTRTDNLLPTLKDQGVTWKGKFIGDDVVPRAYWEDRPFLAVPIRSATGSVCGVIRVSDRNVGSFSERDQSIVQAFADCLGRLPSFAGSIGPAGARVLKRIFLGYGHNLDAKDALEGYLKTKGFSLEMYEDRIEAGKFVFDNVLDCMENSDAAIILYTGDDTTTEGLRIGRRNVAYELGMAHRSFGPRRTVLVIEDGVEQPTNVQGMQVVRFKAGELPKHFAEIGELLRRMGEHL